MGRNEGTICEGNQWRWTKGKIPFRGARDESWLKAVGVQVKRARGQHKRGLRVWKRPRYVSGHVELLKEGRQRTWRRDDKS